jgi:hypothetical protein
VERLAQGRLSEAPVEIRGLGTDASNQRFAAAKPLGQPLIERGEIEKLEQDSREGVNWF